MAKRLLKERFQQLAGIKPLYELEKQSSEYTEGDKVKFNPSTMIDKGFENDMEYYNDLTGIITKVSQDELEIKLNKSITPPGGGNIDGISLWKSEGDYEMIEKDDDEDYDLDPEDGVVDEIELEDLDFETLKSFFPKFYQNEKFTRTQPNGEEGSYYSDSISFPNLDDSSMEIGDSSALEDWKDKVLRRFGNVEIVFNDEAKNSFDRVFVSDDDFNDARDEFIKGKMSALNK